MSLASAAVELYSPVWKYKALYMAGILYDLNQMEHQKELIPEWFPGHLLHFLDWCLEISATAVRCLGYRMIHCNPNYV